ncbi:DNA repair/transcription protein met18/mms19, putative [Entamoeba histolytica KU27]|uniref:MMS19 nucleotide excision repair protein n=1 Tax=Entamoeba histolytica KU27 TaxID=885311 RepID=M2Q3N0_ENTHI|nr:DNA repair/transcription protein met18/mms19, putative [Entamoeba histolytica KU27]
MSTPTQQLNEFIESPKVIKEGYEIIDQLMKNNYNVNSLVTDLGDTLPSEDERIRFRATSLLTYCLIKYPIKEESKDVFVDYLASRLVDAVCLEPILTALLQLVTKKPSDEIINEIAMAYSCMRTQLYTKEVRILVYQFYKVFINYYQATEVIDTCVQLIELERDPECLKEVFDLIKLVSQKNEIDADSAPLLFDCASAYFPILYPPKGDEALRIDLTNKILDAFVSAPIYAQFALPFLLDKLDADLSSIKLEALKAIYFCIQRFELKYVYAYFTHIWESIEQNISTVGVVEVNEFAFAIASYFCSLDDFHSKNLMESIKMFCLRMMSETDEIIINFVNGLLEELTKKSEKFFKVFVPVFIQCFHDQLQDADDRPKEQFERELFIVRLIYQRIIEGMPLLDCVKGQVAWDLHRLATPLHPCFVSLLDIDVSLALLNLLGEQRMVPFQNAIELSENKCHDAIPILQRLYEKEEDVMISLLPANKIITNLELVSGIALHSPKLFEQLLKLIPTLQSNEYVPVFQSILSDALPFNCLDVYVNHCIPVFIVITNGVLSPLFNTLMNRLSRLHSILSSKKISELTEGVLSQLKEHSRLLLILPSLLQFYQPENLIVYLNEVQEVDKDTIAIYSLLISKLTNIIPHVLEQNKEYFNGYKTIQELDSHESNKQATPIFIEELCRMNNKAIECLKEMIVFDSINKKNELHWKEELFNLVYERFIESHQVTTVEESHIMILLFSLLPTEKLLTYESTVLKIFNIICVPTSHLNEIDSVVVLLFNILPTVSQYPMSLIESELDSIITKLFNVLYINGTTIKYRCDIIDLLTRIRVVYGIDAIRPYQKNVIKKLLVPLDDNKRLVRRSAAICRNIWETTA